MLFRINASVLMMPMLMAVTTVYSQQDTATSCNLQTQYLDFRHNEEARFMAMSDSGLWLGGTNDHCDTAMDFFLIHLNLQNQHIQSRCLGTPDTDVLLGGARNNPRSRMVLCGETRPSITNTNALAVITNGFGQQLYQRVIGLPTKTESLKTAVFMQNGNIAFTGLITDATGTNNVWILCTDSALNTRWELNLGGNGNDVGNAIANDGNDTLYVLADSNSEGNGGYDAMLIKVWPDGQAEWIRYYGNEVNNGTQGIFKTSDGYWLIFGETEAPTGPPFNFWTRKIAHNGDQVWEKEFGGNGTDALFAGLEYNNQFYFSGYSNSLSSGQPIDAAFCTTDTSCSSFTLSQTGRSGIDIGYCMDRKGDTLAIAGRSFGQDEDMFYSLCILRPQGFSALSNKPCYVPFPNPASEILYLPEGTKRVEVFNLMGQHMDDFVARNNSGGLILGKLPFGTYICKTILENTSIHFTFIHHE